MELGKLFRLQADRAVALLCAVAAAIMLLVGWFGVSRYAYPADQIPYVVSGAIGGLFLLGIAATLWISADVRDEWRKLDRIDEALRQLAGSPLVNVPTNGHSVRPAEAEETTRRPDLERQAMPDPQMEVEVDDAEYQAPATVNSRSDQLSTVGAGDGGRIRRRPLTREDVPTSERAGRQGAGGPR